MDENHKKVDTEEHPDDVVTGLPSQQYDQDEPLPPAYTYPTHPGRGVHPTDGESTHVPAVTIYEPQPVTQQPGQHYVYTQQVVIGSPLTDPPSSNMGWSICSCICCCWLIGIFAILASGKLFQRSSVHTVTLCLIQFPWSDQISRLI